MKNLDNLLGHGNFVIVDALGYAVSRYASKDEAVTSANLYTLHKPYSIIELKVVYTTGTIGEATTSPKVEVDDDEAETVYDQAERYLKRGQRISDGHARLFAKALIEVRNAQRQGMD